MNGAVIAIIVLSVVFIIALVFILMMARKKMTDEVEETVAIAENTGEFMPFDDIENSMIVCANYTYRAVIECSSINLGLCASGELARIQDSYYKLMDSVDFPFSMYIITKELDNAKMTKRFEELSEDPLIRYPSLTAYQEAYLRELRRLPEKCGNSKQKKKYIIISYDEAGSMDKLTDDEKFRHSAKELANRCNVFIEGLQRVGISAHILTSDEIADLLYSVYHKESMSSIANILEGDFNDLVVEGTNNLQSADAYQFMDLTLSEAINELNETVLNNKEIPEYEKLQTKELIDDIAALRKKHSGFYQTEAFYVDTDDMRKGGNEYE